MPPLVSKHILLLIIDIPAAALMINILFKKSMFVNIEICWLINFLFVIINTCISDYFPEQYPYTLIFFFYIAALCVLFLCSYHYVSKPLKMPISDTTELAKGRPNYKVNKQRILHKDEIDNLNRINQGLKDAFRQVITDIRMSIDNIALIRSIVNQTSVTLSQVSNSQASSQEKFHHQ